MSSTSPIDTVSHFVQAMNRADIDTVMASYEPDAVLIAEPGRAVSGPAAIREALLGMLALKPKLSTLSQDVVLAGDLALYHSSWQMVGTAPDGSAVAMSGQSADVLRRQPDGQWRIAIDNPWGTVLLQAER